MRKIFILIITVTIITFFITCSEPNGNDGGGDIVLDIVTIDSNCDNCSLSFEPDTFPNFYADETVTITVNTDTGYDFAFWSNDENNYPNVDYVQYLTDNGNGTYSITMDEDKHLMAVFATEAQLDVEETGHAEKLETIFFKYDVVVDHSYDITYADGTADGYISSVRRPDGEVYHYWNHYTNAGTVNLESATEDVIFVEFNDWGGADSEGGTFSLTVTDVTTK